MNTLDDLAKDWALDLREFVRLTHNFKWSPPEGKDKLVSFAQDTEDSLCQYCADPVPDQTDTNMWRHALQDYLERVVLARDLAKGLIAAGLAGITGLFLAPQIDSFSAQLPSTSAFICAAVVAAGAFDAAYCKYAFFYDQINDTSAENFQQAMRQAFN